jgi:hypothetical protein
MLDCNTWGRFGFDGGGSQWDASGLNLDLGTYQRRILKPLPYLRFSLDLFPDCFAIAAHQSLIQTCKPLTDHPLLEPAVTGLPFSVEIPRQAIPLIPADLSNYVRSPALGFRFDSRFENISNGWIRN